MKFKNDILLWKQDQDSRSQLKQNTIRLPSTQEVFFEAKVEEIIYQYQSARIMMYELETNDWNHWYKRDSLSKNHPQGFDSMFKSIFIETAIIYYNIVIDLTWTLFLLSTEYAVYSKNGILELELSKANVVLDTLNTIRLLEKKVNNPSVQEDDTQKYFMALSDEYKAVFEYIVGFWNNYSGSEIRCLYNYIKHRGKPLYSEGFENSARKIGSIFINKKEYASDITDVKYEVSIEELKKKLIEFDDNMLFPYCNTLIQMLISSLFKGV